MYCILLCYCWDRTASKMRVNGMHYLILTVGQVCPVVWFTTDRRQLVEIPSRLTQMPSLFMYMASNRHAAAISDSRRLTNE